MVGEFSVFSHRDTGNGGGRAPNSDRAATHTRKRRHQHTVCEMSSQSLALKASAFKGCSGSSLFVFYKLPWDVLSRRSPRLSNIEWQLKNWIFVNFLCTHLAIKIIESRKYNVVTNRHIDNILIALKTVNHETMNRKNIANSALTCWLKFRAIRPAWE